MFGKNKSHVNVAKSFFVLFLVIELSTNLITHRADLKRLSEEEQSAKDTITFNQPNVVNNVTESRFHPKINLPSANVTRNKTVITVSMFIRCTFSAFGMLSAIGQNTTLLTTYCVFLTLMDLLFLFLKTCHGLPFPMLPVLDAALIFSSGFLVVSIKVQHERLQNEKLNSLLPIG